MSRHRALRHCSLLCLISATSVSPGTEPLAVASG